MNNILARIVSFMTPSCGFIGSIAGPIAGQAASSLMGKGKGGDSSGAGGLSKEVMAAFRNILPRLSDLNIGAQQVYNAEQANPYRNQYVHDTAALAPQYSQLGRDEMGTAGQLGKSVSDIYQSAFDPQNDLYGRTLQRVQDQTRAGDSARGLAMSPYSAGIESDATKNFNIDWQNNQLSRMGQGIQGMAQGGVAQNNIGAQGLGLQMQGAGLPYQTQQQYYQDRNANIGNYLGDLGSMSNILGVGGQTAMPAMQNQQQQQGAFGSALSSFAGGLSNQIPWGNMFGGGGGSGSGGGFVPYQNAPPYDPNVFY